jgi:preprotein translocase subunit SecB
MDNDLREKMIRQQAPAIIMPYLRATISMMLISAGFGGVTMPLINLYEMAGRNKQVNIVHADKSSGATAKKKPTAKQKK